MTDTPLRTPNAGTEPGERKILAEEEGEDDEAVAPPSSRLVPTAKVSIATQNPTTPIATLSSHHHNPALRLASLQCHNAWSSHNPLPHHFHHSQHNPHKTTKKTTTSTYLCLARNNVSNYTTQIANSQPTPQQCAAEMKAILNPPERP
jgi:hypothetical protein